MINIFEHALDRQQLDGKQNPKILFYCHIITILVCRTSNMFSPLGSES